MADQTIYEYRCVAGPTNITIAKPEDHARAASAFEEIMNREAADGWEYVGMDQFQTIQPPGCLGLRPAIVSTPKMLVFKRPKA
ncbi:MAG: DUF4177 domain-containing protein [Geminicoccaceae bacterium]